ncbi:enoyl-CoA hydratase [Oceanibacterium hippocampi]|uniref:Enoyl-CoA hydratase domain-containing protein 3, mitochondrial n=1 Tax=Oceanibacterium hippocampi TaxID=745714 RepID=A0A1Y5SQA0_9PROT|nr:enoyl-CoA hydratase [Oceanibacterium hippocampi]SLN45287.1 putative enoyl-CoA hydratase echA8 [Oceanibacterium hippocampi]
MPTAQNEESLLRDNRDGIATLTLNRPRQRNALSGALIAAIHDALRDLEADDSVRVVVIAASGTAFSAGHDLAEVRAIEGVDGYRTLFRQCSDMMLAVLRHPKPVIARVQGTATAAGCQLVASCDLAVAAADARFATPGVNIGLFCSTPMVALSRNVGRKQAMEMLLTGDMIDAATARDFGLVNRVVEAARLEDETLALARQIAEKSPLTLKIGKEAFYRQLELGVSDAYDYASEVMTRNMLARDAGEGISAFLEKRPPRWEGR